MSSQGLAVVSVILCIIGAKERGMKYEKTFFKNLSMVDM